MNKPDSQTDNRSGDLLHVLALQLSDKQPVAWTRLEKALEELQNDFSNRRFFHVFALCPRWFDRQANDVAADKQDEWDKHDPYKVLQSWQYPQLARLLVLLKVEQAVSQQSYVESVNELYKTADVNELILLGQSLVFLSNAELFVERARESARSNIAPVFSSVAHNSDYARRYFDKTAWNQLVLKAAFLGQPIWSIEGLKQRNNAELVTMLRHYVNERQAAARSVPWDLWCCIGWLAQSEKELDYLRQQSRSAAIKTQAAIALALSENPDNLMQSTAEELWSRLPDRESGRLSWRQLAAWLD
jgi:hypothetical protein